MEVNAVAMVIILGYYLIINLTMYVAMVIDKNAAIKEKRRIPEKNLYLLSVLGGGGGGLIAMITKHHKNRHLDFILVFTVTAVLHLLAIYWLITKFGITFS